MKIFIDFDDVIFNTRDFKDDFKNIFSRFGITDDIFQKNYYNYEPNFREYPVRTYSPKKHLAMISQTFSFDSAALEKSIQEFLPDTRKYIFSDVDSFLKKFSRSELFLVSHGDSVFQRKKIDNAGMDKYFSEVEISPIAKSQEIKEIIDKKGGFQAEEEYFFLDDRAHYIEEVKRRLPEITAVLIQRPEGRYQDQPNCYCDFTAKNLRETWKIISKLRKKQ